MPKCLVCGLPIEGPVTMRRMGSIHARLPDGSQSNEHADCPMHPDCAASLDGSQYRSLGIALVLLVALVVGVYLYLNRGY